MVNIKIVDLCEFTHISLIHRQVSSFGKRVIYVTLALLK